MTPEAVTGKKVHNIWLERNKNRKYVTQKREERCL